jgi:1-acyl-sn-glycerol-3-phosphate acyltransferase
MSLARGAARLILQLLGWRLLDPAQRPAKAVVIGYPHTSNWDFPLGLLAMAALSLDARWVGKDTLFRHGCGPVMRALGGIPVNRRARTGFVERMAEEFGRQPALHLVMAPEGTRRRTGGWKSGFYRIALAAQVPVVVATIDWSRREVGLLSSITLSGDEAADMARIAAAYDGRRGYRHENASPIRLL